MKGKELSFLILIRNIFLIEKPEYIISSYLKWIVEAETAHQTKNLENTDINGILVFCLPIRLPANERKFVDNASN